MRGPKLAWFGGGGCPAIAGHGKVNGPLLVSIPNESAPPIHATAGIFADASELYRASVLVQRRPVQPRVLRRLRHAPSRLPQRLALPFPDSATPSE